eukprot:CAMPEP_0168567750 /NCGR_PEP_ID=MMETSP0413-20121227/15182_1 /TAXON_ID=136452 /ORGANISM="Filamoeba nolandi, Strain NC-AS-23-1" /LENGTH=217 /DNA_ID=CAMNT_0008599983 /DNA_START=3 /DNA_END=653 /DNA_ORIENTATION=-
MIQKLNNNNEVTKTENYKALKDVSESETSVESKHKLKHWNFKHIDSDLTDAESVSGRSDFSSPAFSVSQSGPEIVYPSSHPFQRRFDSVTTHQPILPQEIKKKEKKRPVSVFEVDFNQNDCVPTTEPLSENKDSTNARIPEDTTQIPEDDMRSPEPHTSSELSANLDETQSRVIPSTYFVQKPILRMESRDKDHLVSAAMTEIENLIDSLSSIITEV